jgi:hypothetical protein
MKTFVIILAVIFLSVSCVTKKREMAVTAVENIKLNNNCEIIKIDSINNIYVLYAKRNDSLVKIVSMKQIDNNCKQIEIGHIYNLKIKSFFSDNFHQKLDIKGFKVSNTIIKLEGNGVIWDLFSTENLKGLCYIEE